MTTILEYGILSGHVYNPSSKSYHHTEIYLRSLSKLSKLVSQDGWYRITDIDRHMIAQNSYFAALYVKFQNGRPIDAVVSIRGTVRSIIGNDVEDIVGWWSDAISKGNYDRVPCYVHPIWGFVIKCIKIAHHLSVKLKLTGHSLGGAIAQIISLTIHTFEAVTFNAPGCGHIPGAYLDRAGAIHNINSRYGLINKVGLVVGEVNYIDVPEMESEAKQLFKRYKEAAAKNGSPNSVSLFKNARLSADDYLDAYRALESDVTAQADAQCQPSQQGSVIRQALSILAVMHVKIMKNSKTLPAFYPRSFQHSTLSSIW